MMLVVKLALRDLVFQKVQLICNVAVLTGVIVPLLVLFGVKNGIYDALIGNLLSNPRTLQIDTSGNSSFTLSDADEVRGWDNVGFVTLKTRSLFDYINVRQSGGTQRRDAILVPSGLGDPNLPDGLDLGRDGVVISDALAIQLDATVGAGIDLITQAEDRPRQLLLTKTVLAILPKGAVSQRAIFAPIETLDLVEAFYDAYSLPEYDIDQGKPLSERVASFEGMRIYSSNLESLGALQAKLETRFNLQTEARTAEVQGVLTLGRNLNLALLLTGAIASLGLAAALFFGFWGEVERKRHAIATLALMGLGGNRLWIFPVVQALVIGVMSLVVSFIFVVVARVLTEAMFRGRVSSDSALLQISAGQASVIGICVIVFVVLSSLFAARSVLNIEPATVLRELAT